MAVNKVACGSVCNRKEWVGRRKGTDVSGSVYLCLMKDEVDWGDEGVHLMDVIGGTAEPSCDGSDSMSL